MKFNKLLLSVFLSLLLPFQLLAWGREGHQIVAQLAMRQLSDATRQKVLQVLGNISPADAGTWMDDIRNDPSYKYMAPWHYTNIDSGARYQPAPGGDIITALNTAYRELEHMDTLNPQRLRFDVLILFHLCGDLMQPLHAGYGVDKGGNNYQVQYNGKGTNLHSLWDTQLIETQDITFASLADSANKRTNQGTQQLRQAPVDFTQALNYSRYLLESVYALKGHKVDEKYIQQATELIRYQLKAAASLLAICLEHVFSQAKTIPVEKTTTGIKPQINNSNNPQVLLAQVAADQAGKVIGQTVVVCGKVYSTKSQEGSGVTFINMGGEYPNNPFTAVIMEKDRINFNYKPEETLNGKTICVKGTVKEYKGKPEIVVEKETQIIVQ